MTMPEPAAPRDLRELLGVGVVLLSALLIGLAPNAAKIAYAEGANLSAVVVIRSVIGTLGIALYLTLRGQWPAKGLAVSRKSLTPGLAQAFTTLGFIGAVAFLDVSLAALIFYFHPFLVALAGHFSGELRMTPALLACIAAASGGLALVFGVTLTTLSPLGVGLSLLGMVAVTVMILKVYAVSKEAGPVAANFFMSAWAAAFLTGLAVIGPALGVWEAMVPPASAIGWIAVAGAGVTTTLGYVLFLVGAKTIGVSRAVVWTIMEPVFAILFAIALVGEWLTPVQWLGVAVVIASLFKFEAAARAAPKP